MSLDRRGFLKAGAVAALAPTAAVAGSGEDPIDRLSDMVGDVPELPQTEYQSRIEKARRLMGEQDLDVFFVEGGSSLRYFSGVSWGRSERMFGLLLTRRGAPLFVSPAFEEGRARERISLPGAELRIWQEHESPFRLAAQALAERGVRTGKVAVEPTTRLFLVSGMREAAPGCEFIDGRTVSDGCRMTKSPAEISLMRRANEITKKAYAAALAGLKEGMSQRDLSRRISDAHSKLGTQGGALALFGPAAAYPHGTKEERKLREGDVVLVDGGCKVHGYSSDVTRTTVFGTPTAKQKEVWEIVREAQRAALAAAKPGVECQELDRVARHVVEKAGYGPGYRYFTHRLGHGIGLDGHESPYLVKGNRLKLQPGMSFSDEPGIYIVGEFGIRLEDIMVITEEGAEFLGEGPGPALKKAV